MSSSQPAESSAHRRHQRHDEPVQVAPYLTHVVAHHGQLTLIPPQNAGRIRKSTKRKKQSGNRDRLLDDEEPRFTTAVPLSSSRKLHPAPAHIRTRKHAISSPAAPSPTTSRRYDPLDDQSIPDYPPPSFEDAIASPHVPPHLSSSATDPVPSLSQTHDSIQAATHSDHLVTSAMPPTPVPASADTVFVSASASTTIYDYDSPAASQVSLTRPVDPRYVPGSSPGRSLRPVPSPLASPSTTTLLSTTAVSESTAFSDTPSLRPPQRSSVPQSSLEQPAPQLRERSPTGAPYRLTSPSTTTLLFPAHAVRDSPALAPASDVSFARPQQQRPFREPATPATSATDFSLSPPSSPLLSSRTSVATASDVFEEFTWEPRQRWSADRRLGLSLEDRIEREFQRLNTQETLSAFAGGHAGAPVDPRTRKCSHCGSLRPLECGDIQSINEDEGELSDEEDANEDEDVDEDSVHHATSRQLPLKGQSPYLQSASKTQSMAKFSMSRSRSQLRLKSQSPEPASPTLSPMSPTSSSLFKMPSAWASSVTLSLTNALGNHSDKSLASTGQSANKSLKRRESFGVKRLFSGLKGKEREHGRSQSLPSAALTSNVNLNASFASSSDSSSTSESIDGWEVVSVGEDSVHSTQSTSTRSTTNSTAPASLAYSVSDARTTSPTTSPSSPTTEGGRPAFLNRPVRHRPALLDSPTTPTSPLPPSLRPVPVVSTPVSAMPPAATRPYLPEKSPLRMLANTQQLRRGQEHIQTPATSGNWSPAGSPSPLTSMSPTPLPNGVTASNPVNPRTVRPSPSIVWKAPSPVSHSPLSQTPASSSPVRSSPLSTLAPPSHPPAPARTAYIAYIPPTPPSHLSTAALSRSERSALRHQSAPLPTMATAMAMSREAQSTGASPVDESPAPSPNPAEDNNAHIRGRRAITPPPSHRHAMLSCDTNAVPIAGPHTAVARDRIASAGYVTREADIAEEPEASPTEQILTVEDTSCVCGDVRISPIPPSPVSIVSTPTTPTYPGGSVSETRPGPSWGHNNGQANHHHMSYHYRGRPLPQLPAEFEDQESVPVKRVPDGYAVNRMPEICAPIRVDTPPPLPPPSVSSSPVVPVSPPAVSPSSVASSPAVSPPASPAVSSSPIQPPSPIPSPPSGQDLASSSLLTIPALPDLVERSISSGSVLEDVREGEEGPRDEYLQITDLDVLASRALEGVEDGRNYEDLLRLSEIMGPAGAPSSAATNNGKRAGARSIPFTGTIEVTRRRVLKDGRVKLKLSLLGVSVDRCGVCLSQFRKDECAALTPACKHPFHEVCLRRWLRTACVCPICRIALSMDD